MKTSRYLNMITARSRWTAVVFPVLAFLLLLSPISASETPSGDFDGAIETPHPSWFKESFLDFREDIAEASAEGRRLLLYFWQRGCPYCHQLVTDNLAHPDTAQTVRAHFDLIAINMWGDREVVRVDGQTFSEKTLAAALQVQFTPTLLFFDESGRIVLRLDGYHPPADFLKAMEYVYLHRENEGNFHDYLMNDRRDETLVKSEVEEWFIPPPYRLNRHIGNASRPLAVFFERAACSQCDILHHQVMREPLTHQLVQLFDNVLLDAAAQTPVITPSGETTTAARWAKELDINYFPTVVLFDPNGTEIVRAAAAFRTFHMQSLFDYVLTGAYRTQPSLQRYLSTRGEQLREAGYDVDIWSYDLPISFDGQPVSLEKIQAVTGGVAAAGD